MADLPLINLILFKFLKAQIALLAVFHCWHGEDQRTFYENSFDQSFYTQLIDLNRHIDWANVENRHFVIHHPVMGVFADLGCNQTESLLEWANTNKLYTNHYSWLIYDQVGDVNKFRDLFVNASLSIGTDLTYIYQGAQGNLMESPASTYVLYDVYNNGHHIGGLLNMTVDREDICSASGCQVGRHLSDLYMRSKYGNRNNLWDVTMRVATVVTRRPTNWPLKLLQEHLISKNNTYVDFVARFGYAINLLYKDLLNCNMSYTFYSGWSVTETSGGIVGAIVDGTADLTSTPYLCTESRLQYVQALAETGGFRSICMFRTPRNSDVGDGVFLEPFSTTVWITFAVTLAVIAAFLWATFFIERRHLYQFVLFGPSLLTTLLISLGSACIQGTSLIPLSTGGRIAFFSLCLISFIMYNYYTSLVVSSLLGSPMTSNIKTLGQLADSNLEVALEPLPFTMVYLNTSRLPEVRRLVKRKIESKKNPTSVWITAEEGIIRVRDNPGFVYIFEASASYALVEKHYRPQEICDLNEVWLRPDKALYTQLHKNSTYKEIIRLKSIQLLETGVYFKHSRYWIHSKPVCYTSNMVINVGMEYTAPLFFMLLYSYGLVLAILAMEICIKKYWGTMALNAVRAFWH